MKVERVVVGELEENCYILSIGNECLVIDPGAEEQKIFESIGTKEVLGVLITHHHFDHVGALNQVLSKYNTQIYDKNNLNEKNYQIGPFKFDVIYNPGHTKDSISFYFKEESMIFVGDFIFLGSVGRCDLDGGNINEMKESINKLKQIHDDIVIYPGHDSKTTLNYEKEFNPYF